MDNNPDTQDTTYMTSFPSLFSVRTISLAALFSLVSGGLLLFAASEISTWLSHKFAQQTAESYAQILSDVHDFYSSEIVQHASASGVKIGNSYETATEPTIPFPATFTLQLLSDLNRKHGDLSFRFYSDYPFRNTDHSGPQDAFEETALAVFRSGEMADYSKLDLSGDIPRIRYARAVRMEQTCVDCHNSLPISPKMDWKVGDIRGVQSVSVPATAYSAWNVIDLGSSTYIALSIYFLLSALAFGLFIILAKYQQEREQKNTIREKNVELRKAAQQITKLAYVDPVSGLGNRIQFNTDFEEILKRASRRRRHFAIVLVDIDHFKNVNDSYGYEAGDFLLETLASRLSSLLPQDGIAARLSGDEFALILPDYQDEQVLSDFCRTISNTLSKSVSFQGLILLPSVSLGAVRTPIDGTNADRLLANAGHALRHVKNSGRDHYYIFDDTLRHATNRARDLGERLKCALDEGSLEVFYQPVVCLQTGRLKGLEALMRWTDHLEGSIPPAEFIPVAEQYGLIQDLSLFLFQSVQADLIKWHRTSGQWIPVAVNLHTVQLRTSHDLRDLLQMLEDAHVPKDILTLEITEDCVIGRGTEDVPMLLKELSEDGYRLSLDDFGTGFASLTHLMDLAVDELKIDRTFTWKLSRDEADSQSIIRAVAELARPLNLDIVAEGIETEEQLSILIDMGLQRGQGFYFMPAASSDVISSLIRLEAPFKDRIPANSLLSSHRILSESDANIA